VFDTLAGASEVGIPPETGLRRSNLPGCPHDCDYSCGITSFHCRRAYLARIGLSSPENPVLQTVLRRGEAGTPGV